MRYLTPAVIAALGTLGGAAVAATQAERCLMRPVRSRFVLPASGVQALPGEEFEGPCDSLPTVPWRRVTFGTRSLLAAADGPSGSGRYWTITIAVAADSTAPPSRGLCFSASTIGWRTLQRLDDQPLKWIDDLDQDGRPEIIAWANFSLDPDPDMPGPFALVAWVYEFDMRRTFALDWRLSRRMAAGLAAAYRAPLQGSDESLRDARDRAAGALDAFATRRCVPGR